METIISLLHRPWPWYVAGPLIGLTVPALLIAGNKPLGISSSLKDICAACMPAGLDSLTYDWKSNRWNLLFVLGILIGGFLAGHLLANPDPVAISARTIRDLGRLNVPLQKGMLPSALFSWKQLLTLRGLILMVVGGFLVGFGTRYAGGCTSGHGIRGLSFLQWPSLVAVIFFFAGGICCTYLILPWVLKL
ncbi:MAG TPA: YeeE/YedE thiosulfate transporter family protein [Chitinophagaceae bacterium]|nr:YeeE/YedE thiosulfate transporter family protein [Chitinophagaceae bacterium]